MRNIWYLHALLLTYKGAPCWIVFCLHCHYDRLNVASRSLEVQKKRLLLPTASESLGPKFATPLLGWARCCQTRSSAAHSFARLPSLIFPSAAKGSRQVPAKAMRHKLELLTSEHYYNNNGNGVDDDMFNLG